MTGSAETPTDTGPPSRLRFRRSGIEPAETTRRPGMSWVALLVVFFFWYPSRVLIGTVEWSTQEFAYSALLFGGAGVLFQVWAWISSRR